MDYASKIARLITEDPDVFEAHSNQWEKNTVLSDENYFEVVAILKDVAKKSGCVLDHTKLKIEFIPPGFIMKNIFLDCPDPSIKKELVDRVATVTGDDSVRHNFNTNLRVNLYNAINKEFADRVREELDLDITHQYSASPPGDAKADRTEVLPMATITVPKVSAEAPEEEMMGPEDMMGPEGPEELGPSPEEELGMGPEEGMPEIPLPPEEEEEEEEGPPPEAMRFEHMSYVDHIADMLTEDPDIFNEANEANDLASLQQKQQSLLQNLHQMASTDASSPIYQQMYKQYQAVLGRIKALKQPQRKAPAAQGKEAAAQRLRNAGLGL